jgi:hypothetical protein
MDLATVDKLLTTTRSVRARLDLTRPVPPELIEECLEIAVQAPPSQRELPLSVHRRHRCNQAASTRGPLQKGVRPVLPAGGPCRRHADPAP